MPKGTREDRLSPSRQTDTGYPAGQPGWGACYVIAASDLDKTFSLKAYYLLPAGVEKLRCWEENILHRRNFNGKEFINRRAFDTIERRTLT
jgi:hypothetical protein